MKRKALIGLVSGIVVLSLAGLRVYGAYQSEHDNALARAAEAERRASILEVEDARIKSQNDCNLEWTKYETARLQKRLADLQGRYMATPHEPFCTLPRSEGQDTGSEGFYRSG